MTKKILLGILILLTTYSYGQKTKTKKGPEGPKMEDKALILPPTKIASVEGITEYRLQNGIQVLLFPDPSKQTITVNITYMVWSKHENYGETGMAHLLEHLVLKGLPSTLTFLKN